MARIGWMIGNEDDPSTGLVIDIGDRRFLLLGSPHKGLHFMVNMALHASAFIEPCGCANRRLGFDVTLGWVGLRLEMAVVYGLCVSQQEAK